MHNHYISIGLVAEMTTSWDNRVKFLVRYMFDLDNNGYLNQVKWTECSDDAALFMGLRFSTRNRGEHIYFQLQPWSGLEGECFSLVVDSSHNIVLLKLAFQNS